MTCSTAPITIRIWEPGEIVFITPEGYEQRQAPGPRLQICSFLWVYYGYPASSYVSLAKEKLCTFCWDGAE